MASRKHRRKQHAIARRLDGARPSSAADGDRRRRPLKCLVRDALDRKDSLRSWTLDDGPPPGS